ncbi:F0F1 ATP synthase subunit B family protein [Altererythrobacter sp. Z27]|uniref:F0F1 ATP synthase subunit B family protein n=1 Tax=Altererythrobacter sp. Z27 TaxID=3461147 RepID=UPI0040443F11
MPQIAQLADTYASQVFWLLIFFGFTFFVIGRGMVPKVMDTVAMRDKQIADDLAAAQAARDTANEQEEVWRQRENANHATAQAVIAKAKADAAAKTEKKVAAAQKRLDTKLAEAETRIAEARSAAMSEVETVAAEAAQDIVARLAGAKVDAAAAKAAVKEALAHG